MATPPTPAHVSTPCNATFTRSLGPAPCRVSCASLPQNKRGSRRSFSIALLLFHWCYSNPKHAYASDIFDKYVKRKKLEPLEAYVPAVLLTQSQFEDLEKTLGDGQPQYAISRSLLRSGPAASLRINIRAVAQYASDDGRGKAASDAVDQCLGALEDLDSLLLHASRNDPTATVESMKAKINIALGALDRHGINVSSGGTNCLCAMTQKQANLVSSLLQTVPSTVLDKGKAIANAYRTPSSPEEGNPEELDPDMKKLEALL